MPKLQYTPPEKFLKVIESAYDLADPTYKQLISDTSCFGSLFYDESGLCPEEDCAIRKLCKNAYHEVASGPQTITKEIKPILGLPVIKEKKEVVAGPKYNRFGYLSQNRPVDFAIESLLNELGNPPELPPDWSYKSLQLRFGEFGRLLISKTASYHAFMVDGTLICRFWTNAANSALVDLSNLLANKAQMEFKLVEISKGMVNKLKPCVARIYVQNDDEARKVAKYMKEAYNL